MKLEEQEIFRFEHGQNLETLVVRHAMLPSHLLEADSLVWGLYPFIGSVYSQTSAQLCF